MNALAFGCLLVLVFVGCVDPAGYRCASSAECNAGVGEQCFGFCASPASSCSSGWRFTSTAAGSSGQCVEISADARSDGAGDVLVNDAGGDASQTDVLEEDGLQVTADVVDEDASQVDQVDAPPAPDVVDVIRVDTGPPTTCSGVTCTGPTGLGPPACYVFTGLAWCCGSDAFPTCGSCIPGQWCEGSAGAFYCCVAP